MADAFAHDEFDDLDLDALDSVAEFINCINGMFATGISNKLKVDMLPPVYKDKEVVLTGNTEGILKFPMYINGKELLLLFAYEGSINMD